MINFQGNMNVYGKSGASAEMCRKRKAADSGKSVNQDKVIIQADSRKIEEKEFAATMAKQVRTSVEKEADMERLSSLSEKIKEGMYQIDAAKIARAILTYGGDKTDERLE